MLVSEKGHGDRQQVGIGSLWGEECPGSGPHEGQAALDGLLVRSWLHVKGQGGLLAGDGVSLSVSFLLAKRAFPAWCIWV